MTKIITRENSRELLFPRPSVVMEIHGNLSRLCQHNIAHAIQQTGSHVGIPFVIFTR